MHDTFIALDQAQLGINDGSWESALVLAAPVIEAGDHRHVGVVVRSAIGVFRRGKRDCRSEPRRNVVSDKVERRMDHLSELRQIR